MESRDPLLNKTPLYPMRFEPIYKDYLWGGSCFRTLFQRDIPDSATVLAESWEITDHPNGRSVISNGPLKGMFLGDIVRHRADDLFGNDCFTQTPERFPLILKFLDAEKPLSFQVHPDDKLSRELNLEDPGKTEVWVVMAARPGSTIWVGTDQKYDKSSLEQVLRQGNLRSALFETPVQVGDCFYLRPGTLHALGEGIVVAEVQTSSDTTFRVYDWDRVDSNGNQRELKTEEAILALNPVSGPVRPKHALKTERSSYEQLVVDEHFTVNRWGLNAPFLWCSDARCHLWMVLQGEVQIHLKDGPIMEEYLKLGDSILTPAVCEQVYWTPLGDSHPVLLDVIVTDSPRNSV